GTVIGPWPKRSCSKTPKAVTSAVTKLLNKRKRARISVRKSRPDKDPVHPLIFTIQAPIGAYVRRQTDVLGKWGPEQFLRPSARIMNKQPGQISREIDIAAGMKSKASSCLLVVVGKCIVATEYKLLLYGF